MGDHRDSLLTGQKVTAEEASRRIVEAHKIEREAEEIRRVLKKR